METFDQNDHENKAETSASAMDAAELTKEREREFFEALQAAEPLLQEPTSAVFCIKRSFKRFKELEAVIESFPFRSEAPLGFRQWWESSEPERRKWLEELKSKRTLRRRSYYVVTNLPLKELGPSAHVGSVFLVLALKDEKGGIRFVKAASGFLVPGTMTNTFRHSPDILAHPDQKRAV